MKLFINILLILYGLFVLVLFSLWSLPLFANSTAVSRYYFDGIEFFIYMAIYILPILIVLFVKRKFNN